MDLHPQTLFSVLGGEAPLRRLVDTFYNRMDLAPEFAGIRALHPAELSGARDKLFWFLCGWSGGPDYYVRRFGHPRLRARHLPFAIAGKERDQWLGCMQWALRECAFPEALQRRLLAAFSQTADWMRNQPE
jgi:hemoglobin